MGEGTVTDVVHEYGCLNGFCLALKDENSLLRKRRYGLASEVKGSERVLKTGVLGAWIHHRGKPKLLNAGKSLEQGMPNDVEQ